MFAGAAVGLWGVRATAVLAGAAWLVSIPLLVLFVPNEPGGGDEDDTSTGA